MQIKVKLECHEAKKVQDGVLKLSLCVEIVGNYYNPQCNHEIKVGVYFYNYKFYIRLYSFF